MPSFSGIRQGSQTAGIVAENGGCALVACRRADTVRSRTPSVRVFHRERDVGQRHVTGNEQEHSMRIRAALVAAATATIVAACAPPPGGGGVTLGKGPVIAVIGDSYLSGQGAPDTPVKRSLLGVVTAAAKWQDRACARSLLSGPGRVAQKLHQLDPLAAQRSINLVNVACSGASLAAGILHPQHLADGSVKPSQIDQVRQLVAGRAVDALIVDGGGNDVHFADIVTNCIIPLHDCSKDASVQTKLAQGLAALNGPHGDDGLYRALIDAIDGVPGTVPALDVKDVFVADYPDPTRNASGGPCANAPLGDPLAGLTGTEATFGSGIVTALDNSLAAMVSQANARPLPHPTWHLIATTAQAFHTSGYCAGAHRSVNTLLDSVRLQNDVNGTVHPNAAGYAVWGDLVTPSLEYLVGVS
jgi:hypothetical protein